MIQKYYKPLNKEKIKQGYERTKRNDKHKEYRDNHKEEIEEAKEYHKAYRDLEKSKKRNLNKASGNFVKGTNFTYLLKAKQQLRECEVRNCQNKGGESRLTRHNKTRKNVNNVKKKDEQ